VKILLSLLIAISSAIIGSVLGRSRRPAGRFSVWQVILIAVVAALVAEGGTVLWVGVPTTVLQPVLGGLALGFVAGFFSGRRTPPPDKLPPHRPRQ